MPRPWAAAALLSGPAACAALRDHTVSGISSGGSMAIIHHVAFSANSKGVGIVAGSPYGCNISPNPNTDCGTPPKSLDWDAQLVRMAAYMQKYAVAGAIDQLSNLRARPAWLFSGTKDTLVYPRLMRAVEQQLKNFTKPSLVASVFDIPAEHAWVVDDSRCSFCHKCAYLGAPYMNDCGYDTASAMMQHLYGGALRAPVAFAASHIHTVSVAPYVPSARHRGAGAFPPATGAQAIGMYECAFVYVPAACAGNSASCRVHVDYHGCGGGAAMATNPELAEEQGLMGIAEANDLVIVWPQSYWSCWDWSGRNGAGFDTKRGPQLSTVAALIDDLDSAIASAGRRKVTC